MTPDFHRIHHSQDLKEGNSNFGSMFSIWDRLFRTVVVAPKEPAEALSMGLPASGRLRAFSLKELVLSPLRR